MNLRLVSFELTMEKLWDEFLVKATNGTFLHKRKYLSYHGNKFQDYSFFIYDKDSLVGVIPIAASPQDSQVAISHPGISFGGIVHSGTLLGQTMVTTLELIRTQLAKKGFSSLTYKSIPYIYNSFPAQDDVYALNQLGAKVSRVYLSSAISIQSQLPINSKNVKKLTNFTYDFEYHSSFEHIENFWQILESNLMKKYSSRPVHSIEEIIKLHSLFHKEIQLNTVHLNGVLLAGIILYKTERVWHLQYMAASDEGRNVQALDWLIQRILENARSESISYLDFGHSNEKEGDNLNSGLFKFKSKFGSSGVTLIDFDLPLW